MRKYVLYINHPGMVQLTGHDDIDNALVPAATRNVFAHLIDLSDRQLVDFLGEISETTKANLKLK